MSIVLTAGTNIVGSKQQPISPLFFNLITLHGDNAYPAGGTPGFQGQIRTLFGDSRTVVAVIAQDCGGHAVVYDPVNDKLKVWAANNTEVAAATDLSATPFTLLVISY